MNRKHIEAKHPLESPLQLQLLISSSEIKQKIETISRDLEMRYEGKEVVLVMALKGAFIFVADLIRELRLPVQIESVHCSSYGSRGTKKGPLTIKGHETLELKGKHVLVVDDIFDSGETLSRVIETLKAKEPQTINSLVLLTKEVPRSIHFSPDYSLFTIADHFVVGYGLDYKEYYRGLPDIYRVEA